MRTADRPLEVREQLIGRRAGQQAWRRQHGGRGGGRLRADGTAGRLQALQHVPGACGGAAHAAGRRWLLLPTPQGARPGPASAPGPWRRVRRQSKEGLEVDRDLQACWPPPSMCVAIGRPAALQPQAQADVQSAQPGYPAAHPCGRPSTDSFIECAVTGKRGGYYKSIHPGFRALNLSKSTQMCKNLKIAPNS